MLTFRADWIVPVAGPPLRRGTVTVHDAHVVVVGPDAPTSARDVVDLGAVAVMPGLVNAHTHLELSWMRGRVAPATSFTDWVLAMLAERGRGQADADAAQRCRDGVRVALAEMRAAGTVAVGDISNDLAHLDQLGDSGLSGVVFHEVLGFRGADAPAIVDRAVRRTGASSAPRGWRVTIVPHAPYSVSPALFREILRVRGGEAAAPLAVHVAEGAEEVELIATGVGRWRDLLSGMDAWDSAWDAPGCSPVAYLDRLGVWQRGALAVHAVRATPDDLACLRDRRATIVTCPRSNRYVGAGDPPVAAFYRSGVPVAIGTDSLTSTDDLNLFAEVARLRRLAPEVSAGRLIESATRIGATALGLDREFGTIAPGQRAALLAVRVPPATTDVEEYLVGGVTPDQVRWVEGCC